MAETAINLKMSNDLKREIEQGADELDQAVSTFVRESAETMALLDVHARKVLDEQARELYLHRAHILNKLILQDHAQRTAEKELFGSAEPIEVTTFEMIFPGGGWMRSGEEYVWNLVGTLRDRLRKELDGVETVRDHLRKKIAEWLKSGLTDREIAAKRVAEVSHLRKEGEPTIQAFDREWKPKETEQ